MNRYYAFIDTQNLHLAIKELGWIVDFKKLRIYLKDRFEIERAFLFLGYLPTNKVLYTSLRRAGFELVFKPILAYKEIIKGNCDAELVLNAMIYFQEYDGAMVISGDGDFFCLLEYLKQKGKLYKIGIPNKKRYSALLRGFNEDFFFISKLQEKLSLNR